jgi:predicted AlkP superfamily pyrophosphatase or phosphodiesterase
MQTRLLTLLLLFSFTFSFASQNRKVLIIGIDGTRSDAFQQANTPNIDGLLSNATYSYDSWHVGITWSGPSWSTILTGVNWNKHGVTDNNFTGSQFNTYPPLPTLAKQIKPNLNCSIVAEWDPLIDDITNAQWNRKVKVADGSNWPTADSAIIELQNPDIDLLFAYFDKVDLTGHTTTFSPSNPLYISAIQDVDSAVGRILNALYARPTYSNEDWLILVVTDHGGNGFFHGGNTLQERKIWWIAAGNAMAHQQITKADPGTYNCHGNNLFDTTCVNYPLMRQSPVHADVTVTALHHLIYDSGINPETKPEWHLDGKSWLLTPNAVKDIAAENLNVFPNPCTNLFNAEGLQFAVAHQIPVELFTVEGKLIFSTIPTVETISITTTGFARGVYLLKAGNVTRKVVLN